jgi:hypothetical protein
VTHIEDVEDMISDLLRKSRHSVQVDRMMRQLHAFIDRMCRDEVDLSSSSASVAQDVGDDEQDEHDDSSGANLVPRIRFTLNTHHTNRKHYVKPAPSSVFPVAPPPPSMTEDVLRRVIREEMSQEARARALLDVYEDPEFLNARKRKMDEALEEFKRQVHEELRPHHDEIRAEVRKRLEERFEKEQLERQEALLKRLRTNVQLLENE